jgi:hypothetical protein
MQTEFIGLKKQIIIACIPMVGSLIVLFMTFINVSKMSRLRDKFLLVFIGLPLIGASSLGLSRLIFYFGTNNIFLNYSLIILLFYYISFSLISIQLIVFKMTEKR